eukprot:CAMPEP_0168613184 /NCGR_PEP_ID=MMETSP0449_2-20121227/3318_1 /TAXON_ID=1082188 /ORGANISM="Strombidium rassoulzadegani, Strain ras09" /LENGTH=61 /DNA_ID=CAMNT_0008653805 /DNA_START=77 /DNA_END=262 /DNA_ORIENTATION=-
MEGVDVVEGGLDAIDQDLPVVDVDAELPLEGVVHQDTGPDAERVVLSVPVGPVGDGDALPP